MVLPSAGDGQLEDDSSHHSNTPLPILCDRDLDDSSIEDGTSLSHHSSQNGCDHMAPQAGLSPMDSPSTTVEFCVNVAERHVNNHATTSMSKRRKKPHPGNEAMPDTGANMGCANPETTQEFEVTDRFVNMVGLKNHTVNDLAIVHVYWVSISDRGPVIVHLPEQA